MQFITPLVVRWQLTHPDGNKAQCGAFLTGDGEAEVLELVERHRRPVKKPKQKQ